MAIDKLEAVIFDLDGVITDSAELHYRAWKNLADRLGIYFDRQINERLKGVPRMESLEIILEKDSIPNRFSDEEKHALAAEKNDEYVKLINTITPDDILPKILELLHELKKSNIKTAIASASRNATTIIKKLGIEHLFDFIVDAAKIENQKPAPDVFLVAAENISVLPSCCVGVEDAGAGIIAIKDAGMIAIGVGKKENLVGADVVIPSTSELTLNLIHEVYSTII